MKFVLLSLLVAFLASGTGAVDCDKVQGRFEACFERGYQALRKHWWSCGKDMPMPMDRKDKLYCRMVEKEFYKECTENDMETPKIDCGLNCRDGVCYKMYGESLKFPADTTVWSENEKYAIVAQEDDNVVLYCKGGIPNWHTDTWNWGNDGFEITGDGELVVSGRNYDWRSGTADDYTPGPGINQFSLTVENDGNMVIRDFKTGQLVWQVGSARGDC